MTRPAITGGRRGRASAGSPRVDLPALVCRYESVAAEQAALRMRIRHPCGLGGKSAGGVGAGLPYPPVPSAPSPNPSHSPTLPPCPPARARPRLAFARRFDVPAQGRDLPLRRQGDLAPCKRGSPEGESPSGKGSGGCAPSFQELVQGMAGWKSLGGSAAGWVGPPTVAMPTQASPCRLQAEGAGLALPGYNLFPFVHFGPSCTEALGLRSARALADTTCSPFSTVSTTPSSRGPRPLIHPVPGRYDSSPFVDLSAAPQSQAARRPSRQRQPEKRVQTIQCKSTPPLPCSLHPHDALPHRSPAIIAFLAHHR